VVVVSGTVVVDIISLVVSSAVAVCTVSDRRIYHKHPQLVMCS